MGVDAKHVDEALLRGLLRGSPAVSDDSVAQDGCDPSDGMGDDIVMEGARATKCRYDSDNPIRV